jgi:hypothetical protein
MARNGTHRFGDLNASRHQLEPSGVTLEQLRASRLALRVPLTTRHLTKWLRWSNAPTLPVSATPGPFVPGRSRGLALTIEA